MINRVFFFAIILIAIVVIGYEYHQSEKRQHILMASNRFVSIMNNARAEAIERGAVVSVCALERLPPFRCGTKADWANGWMAFISSAQGKQVLMKSEPLPEGMIVVSNMGIVTYDWLGALLTPPLTLKISTQGCHGLSARMHAISADGQLYTETVAC